MNIKHLICNIANYYRRNRQTGQTTAIALGAIANPNTRILFATAEVARYFKNQYHSNPIVEFMESEDRAVTGTFVNLDHVQTLTLSQMENPASATHSQGPLLIDGYAMMILMDEIREFIETLEHKLTDSKMTASALQVENELKDRRYVELLRKHREVIEELERLKLELEGVKVVGESIEAQAEKHGVILDKIQNGPVPIDLADETGPAKEEIGLLWKQHSDEVVPKTNRTSTPQLEEKPGHLIERISKLQ